jgi:hypothetical protein
MASHEKKGNLSAFKQKYRGLKVEATRIIKDLEQEKMFFNRIL